MKEKLLAEIRALSFALVETNLYLDSYPENAEALAYFAAREEGRRILDSVDTEDTARMVHVRPILTVVRPDIAKKPFTREELQAGAPDAGEGFWRVPRVLE